MTTSQQGHDASQHPSVHVLQLQDKAFAPFLSEAVIQARVAELGQLLCNSHAGTCPVFLVMLKGAAMFAADLIRHFSGPAEVSYVRTQSYQGTESTRQVRLLLEPNPEEVFNRDIILIEDIVDTGHTLHCFLPLLQSQQPKSITLVTLLFKPDVLEKKTFRLDHVGFSIPPKFVVGYGLDCNGLGRNLRSIYALQEQDT